MTRNTDKHSSSPSICFVAHNAYGAMSGCEDGFIGGAERQASVIARWFAGRGYRVGMVTWDEGQADGVEVDGVRVFKMCRKDAGLPGLRFFWPRWTSLNAAMRRANADIYYQSCAEYVTGQVAMWCRRHGRRLVYSVASDPDCDVRLPGMQKIREWVLYRYGLKHADGVITQTRRQKEMLRDGFGRESVVIPMPCPGPPEDGYPSACVLPADSHRVLWIGRVCEAKRPDRLLDLASRCPNLVFDFVGPIGDTAYAHDVIERAKKVSNVIVHGRVSQDQVVSLYRNATVMCCTSDFEGFPNTFLEAWSHGLPIVSTFDPDNMIADRSMGVAVRNVEGLACAISELHNSPDHRRWMSDNARRYYLENHAVDAAMVKFERVLVGVLDQKQNTRR